VRSGEPEAALPYFSRRVQLDPLSPNTHMANSWLGYAYLLLGRVDEAIDRYYQARAAEPRSGIYHIILAAALGYKGEIDEARASLAEGLDLTPKFNSVTSVRNDPFFKVGNNRYHELWENKGAVGLRRAGLPEA